MSDVFSYAYGVWSNSEPFAIIDFEASSLDENSYPIEVGVVIVRNNRLKRWSSLIRPTFEWKRRDAWSARSQRIHRIEREWLEEAPTPRTVLAKLNECVASLPVVHCDGGQYDAHWLAELVGASAGLKSSFELADISLLLSDPRARQEFAEVRHRSGRPHRAMDDAYLLANLVLRLRHGAEQ